MTLQLESNRYSWFLFPSSFPSLLIFLSLYLILYHSLSQVNAHTYIISLSHSSIPSIFLSLKISLSNYIIKMLNIIHGIEVESSSSSWKLFIKNRTFWNLVTLFVCLRKRKKKKINSYVTTTGPCVNFTIILRAAFAPIF